MRIAGVLNSTRKVIKKLSNLYIAYTLDKSEYFNLVSFISDISSTTDQDLQREISMINDKLANEILQILSTGN